MTSAADSSRHRRKSLARRWAIAAWRDLDSPERETPRRGTALVLFFVIWFSAGLRWGFAVGGWDGAVAYGSMGIPSAAVCVVLMALGHAACINLWGWATDLRAAADEID